MAEKHFYKVWYADLPITRCDFAFTHGIAPSVAVLHALGSVPPPITGDLLFADGDTALLIFRDCAMDPTTLEVPLVQRGYRMRYNVVDRRWRWRYTTVTGRYNARMSDGTIAPQTYMSYRNLISLVLDAMGESGYTITLPNEAIIPPSVEWYEHRADLQLAWLCDRIGCLIILGLDSHVYIRPNGWGPTYPANGKELVPRINTIPSSLPKAVMAIFSPTRYQMKLKLEAVGLDADGASILPIDRLPYRPSGGWSLQIPGRFEDITDLTDRELATETVYRWYRIKEFAGLGKKLTLPDGTSLSHISNILPLHDTLVRAPRDKVWQLGRAGARPYVEGRFFNGDMTGLNEASSIELGTPPDAEWGFWDDESEIDYAQGIVKFPYPVVKLLSGGHQDPAELYLTCAFNARIRPTATWTHRKFLWNMPTVPTTGVWAAQVDDPDVFGYAIQNYKEDKPSGTVNNFALVDAQGAALAGSHACHFTNIPKMSMQWNGIIPYPVTGNVHVMRWKLGGGEPTTWGGKNIEYRYLAPSYQERKIRHEASRMLRI